MTDSGGGSTVQGYTITIRQPNTATASPSATPQSTPVTTPFEVRLGVRVLDAIGATVEGAQVTWTPPGSGPSGAFSGSNVTFTDSTGVAVPPTFTANSVAGSYVVPATVIGVASPANFSLTNLAGAPASITSFAGTPQSATVNTNFGTALQALVRDSFGNPVPGISVTFTPPPATGPSGTFATSSTVATGGSGVAVAPTFTANTHAGSYIVTASATLTSGTGSTNFNMTNNPGAAFSLSATAGTPQSASINTAFATAMQATAFDSFGNVATAAGFQVTFAAPGSGPSGTFGSSPIVFTNSSGVATAPTFTANTTVGGPYTVTATGSGLTTPAANFSLTNTTGGPASITATAGTPQSATVNTAFATQFQATVRDAGGNPVNGVTVTFTAPGSGASGSFAGGVNTAVTNSSGVATSATFSANTTAGSYTVAATVAGVGAPANFSLTNNPGTASSFTSTGGTPQSTTVNTAFAAPLQVTVKDSFSNPVPGVTVTYIAPGSGASGTFAGGVNTAVTNSSGVATSATFTANATTGGYTVTTTVGGVGTAASFSLTNTAGAPGSVMATGGTPQNTTVNTAFGSPLQATVKDGSGNPVSGATVTFSAPGSGASGTFAGGVNTAITNSSGVATSAVFTANTISGSYTVNAAVAGVGSPAAFAMTNDPGAASSVTATAGTPQSTQINTQFAIAFQATVRDSFGNPVPGVLVTFTEPPQTGPSGTFPLLADFSGSTNSLGVVTAPPFTANAITGSYTVTATAGRLATPANFNLTNTSGAPGSITPFSGTPQSTTINTAFPAALQAKVTDANGNPVLNVNVTFTAPGSGASGSFAASSTVQTGANGVAAAPTFTANSIAGSYTVTASAPGVAAPANFSLTNNPGGAASVTATAGTPQNATINTAFPVALQATVKDAGGNPVPSAQVTFSAPASGASGTFSASAIVTSNASGVATAPTFTANSIAGSYSVTATSGAATPAAFSLTNNVGAPFSITAVGGSGQFAPVGASFASPLQALVKDVGGNPVANALVTFSVPGSGASASFKLGATTVATNASGIAVSPGLSANSIEGSYSATATVPGVATAATYLLTNTGGLSITTTQLPTGTVGTPYGASVGATGGAAPYNFSVASGGVPQGLIFNSSGSFSGTPQVPGSTAVQITVVDGNGASASRTFTLKVVGQLTIVTSATLPGAVQGQGYNITFSATGGEPPYTWTLIGGSASAISEKEKAAVGGGLPPGLNFDPLTGTLSGTPTTLGNFSFGIQVSDTAQRQASKSFSLTSALPVTGPGGTPPGPPAVVVSQTQLDFQGPTDGNTPPPQYVSVVAANFQPLSTTIELDSGAPGTPAPPWLSARFVSATTPARLAIFTNQVGLRAGAYKGRVLVKYATAQTLVVDVNFTIDLTPPQLNVSPSYLRFAAINGVTGTLEQALLVTNNGTGGALAFTATVQAGKEWLTVTPGSGTTAINTGSPLRVIVNPQGLKIGSYLGKIRVQGPVGGSVDVPVSLFVSPNGPIIGLSTTGLRYDARQGNGLGKGTDVTVLNVGSGTVNWKAELQTGGENWAAISPATGQATPNASGKFTVTADPRSLAAGPYYALIRVTDPQALNSPQFVVAVLNVQPSVDKPQPDISPAGLHFSAVSGGAVPAPQALTIYGGGDQPVSYQAAASSDDGGGWLSIDKLAGTASTPNPGQILVSVNQANLKPGVYTGDVSVSFSSQTIRTANITLVVLPGGAVLSDSKERSATGCTPSKLALNSSTLVNAFSSPAGWPTPMSIRVTDDCGTAVPNSQVVATFSNGDPPLALSLTNPAGAQFSGTWAPGKTASQMTVTVNAISRGFQNAVSKLTGTVGPNPAPSLNGNGTVNNLTGQAGAALAPGTVVQIFGGGLAPITSQPGVIPLPTTFNNTTVLIGAFAAPLYFLSGQQINAQIPTELQPDRQYQILVNPGAAFTLPDTITITQVSPGLLNFAQHADFSLITPSSPAKAGETILLYLVGMGATSPSVASGVAAPNAPLANATVQPTVSIGGNPGTVTFAGLTPGLVGLYQIDVQVPDATPSGDISVTVTQNGADSNTVTIPVQ